MRLKTQGVARCSERDAEFVRLIYQTPSSRQAVQHNDVNVFSPGGLVVSHALVWELLKTFLAVRFSGAKRHRRRFAEAAELESREGKALMEDNLKCPLR